MKIAHEKPAPTKPTSQKANPEKVPAKKPASQKAILHKGSEKKVPVSKPVDQKPEPKRARPAASRLTASDSEKTLKFKLTKKYPENDTMYFITGKELTLANISTFWKDRIDHELDGVDIDSICCLTSDDSFFVAGGLKTTPYNHVYEFVRDSRSFTSKAPMISGR